MLAPTLILLLTGCRENAPYARAVEMESLTDGIGGPKAMGRPGDFLLENDRVRFVIRGAVRSLGPHTSGGSLIDADLQRDDPRYSHGHGGDLFAEMFPTVNMNVPVAEEEAGTVTIVNDGSDGGAAIVRVEGPSEPFLTLLGGLWQIVGQPDFMLRTDYILEPGVPAVKMRTTALFGATTFPESAVLSETSEESLDVLGLAIEDGATFGDFYLQGGSTDVFTPGIGFDEDSYVAELAEQGINTFQEPILVDYLAGTADGVSYALMPDQGRLFVPLFTSSQTAGFGAGTLGEIDDSTGEMIDGRFTDGTALYYDRWFSVGDGDVGSALDNMLEARGIATGRVSGHVLEAGTGTPLSNVHVFVFKPGEDAPWSEMETDVGDDTTPDGSFAGNLPPGSYELVAYAQGRPLGDRVAVDVAEGDDLELTLSSPQPGSVSFRVVDETGQLVPAKITFFREDGESPLNTVLGDAYIAGSPASVLFAPYGTGQLVLPTGTYTAIASRGVEYDLGVSEPFTVAPDRAVKLQDLQVIHSVDTDGWVSADLHVHAIHSFDSGTPLQSRVTTMVCEGVEFLSSNDHDAVTDYAPVIEDMGLEPWISSAIGVEVTTLELGHFLGFPLQYDSRAEQGGAFDWTAMTPAEITEGIRALGVPGETTPVVFVGHPRDGILGYFDQFGLNPYEGVPGNEITAPNPTVEPSLLVSLTNELITEQNFSTDFDALELLNAKRFELIRSPTAPELAGYAADTSSVSIYDILSRTMAEQEDLENGVYTLGSGHEGQIDDWFTLLNLGLRYTALGNSDTHSKTSVESGCPRNFVLVDSDTPGLASPADVAEAVRAGRVVASYGPFIRFWANDSTTGPGDTVVDADTLTLGITVESPDWFDVDRVELYENGTLIQEWELDAPDGVVDLDTTVDVTPSKDSWYVVIALGQDSLAPVFTPVEIPPIQLQDVVTDALSGVDAVSSFLGPAVPIPRTFPILPYALTNPIFVDQDGDGFQAPGLPDWLGPPAEEDATD